MREGLKSEPGEFSQGQEACSRPGIAMFPMDLIWVLPLGSTVVIFAHGQFFSVGR
jgi:hypothetical protein